MSGFNYSTPVYPSGCAAVTPGATVFEPSVITVMGAAGSVTVVTAMGQTLTFPAMQPGWDIPVLCTSVTAATATDIFRSY